MSKQKRLGLSCGTLDRMLHVHSRGENGIRPRTENRDYYEAMRERGVFKRNSDFVYFLTSKGEEVAEWCMAILPQNQVKIRWKRIPR